MRRDGDEPPLVPLPDDTGGVTGARVVRAGFARISPLRGGRGHVRHLVDRELGATLLDVHINHIRPGSGPGPYHVHRRVENVYVVLEGVLRVRVADSEVELARGDALFVPPGTPHSATNPTAREAVVLEVYAPADADFVDVTGPASQTCHA